MTYKEVDMDWATFPWGMVFVMVTVTLAGIAIVAGVIVPAIGQAIVASSAMSAMARQPEASDAINRALILSLALLESLAIYVLAVILILLFANPLTQYILGSGG
jgi:F-type H+-transporting ATPase subunit c